MLYLVERKKIVIVGIPGVGKTSLVTRIVELINAQKHCASVHSYGSVMMDEATNNQVSDRDNLVVDLVNKVDLEDLVAEVVVKVTDQEDQDVNLL